MRKIVAIESTETKLQPPTQDYLDWLNRATESNPNPDLPHVIESNVLDVAAQSFTSMAWAINMAKNFNKTLEEFQKTGGGDRLKLLTSALALLAALASGLWSTREQVKKLGVSKP